MAASGMDPSAIQDPQMLMAMSQAMLQDMNNGLNFQQLPPDMQMKMMQAAQA